MDKRNNRVQPVRLSKDFFPVDIHKSMFINDLLITIPVYYVNTWGKDILDKHNTQNYFWEVELLYESPKQTGNQKFKFNASLSLSFSVGRSKESSYRLRWDKDFASQLAKDYPKSFVRALDFHLGDDYYKKIKFTEFDVGGFKEQLQLKIEWKNNKPFIQVKEYFRVREESQLFPFVFKELSSYLIADYLIGSEEELQRRILTTKWKPRSEIQNEINENNIYILINREEKKVYFGETKLSLSKRYPVNQEHHSFEDWTEYSVIQLPPETTNHTRLLIERVLISVGGKIFQNHLFKEEPLLDVSKGLILVNKKK
jgi:hypothetical protein